MHPSIRYSDRELLELYDNASTVTPEKKDEDRSNDEDQDETENNPPLTIGSFTILILCIAGAIGYSAALVIPGVKNNVSDKLSTQSSLKAGRPRKAEGIMRPLSIIT